MKNIRAWMSLKFGQIRQRTTELAALERLKNGCCHFFSVSTYLLHFILVGIDDMQNI